MQEFKEFQGKSLDEAIRIACNYFDAPREKLEIDLVQDAKNGIFGLVGMRNAIIRARRSQLQSTLNNLLDEKQKKSKPVFKVQERHQEKIESKPDPKLGRKPKKQFDPELDDSIGNRIEDPLPQSPEFNILNTYEPKTTRHTQGSRDYQKPRRQERTPNPLIVDDRMDRIHWDHPKPILAKRPAPLEKADKIAPVDKVAPMDKIAPDVSEVVETFIPFSALDQGKLIIEAQKIAQGIMSNILGEVPIEVTIQADRVFIQVDCGEDSGLLIGREGMTLTSLQYITSRMLSRIMDASVRVQFDIGDYRERQDDRLYDLAFVLAARVRQTGRPASTKPLSSYHRRVIHMALQNEADLFTRSFGDGALKRVIIQKKR